MKLKKDGQETEKNNWYKEKTVTKDRSAVNHCA